MTQTSIVTTLLVALVAASNGATIPYSENFDSYDNISAPAVVPAGFTESPGPAWNVRDDGAGKDYENAVTEVNGTGSINTTLHAATIQLTNVAGNNFTMSAEMTIDAASGSGSALNNLIVGLQFLGSGAFSPGYTAELDVLGTDLGTLRISENDTLRASSLVSGTLMAGTIYTLTVTGTYAGGNLTIGFDFGGGTSSGNVSFFDTTPQTGQGFGFRNLTTTGPGGTVTLDLDYDNLVVIPEPGSGALLGLGICGLATLRRRTPGRQGNRTSRSETLQAPPALGWDKSA